MAAAPVTSRDPTRAEMTADEADDLDEPPELKHRFERTIIRRQQDQASLLTRGLMGEPEDFSAHHPQSILVNSQRRRSLTSNISVASTADLTSDTGLTSPCRTNTPSPPIPELTGLRLHHDLGESKPLTVSALQPPKKRCIQFACAKPPVPQAEPMSKAPSAEYAPRQPSIKFPCPTRPASTQNTPPRHVPQAIAQPIAMNPESPSTPKKASALSLALDTSPRGSGARRLSIKSTLCRPKFLRANSKDLAKDSSQFHEFASGTAREEDWIRQQVPIVDTKLTIDDTLSKENHFRRLGAEAEAEAELEEEEEEEDEEDVNEDDDDDDADEDEDENKSDAGLAACEEDSDGYHTDSETGFAESDEEEEEDENMILWTPSHAKARRNPAIRPVRRSFANEPQSDSSVASRPSTRRTKTRRIKIESDAPDLPDSTDFVCGTLDEDRPLEEAYMSCLAARRNEKLRVIPQDIDPSFPASDPDDDDEEEENYHPLHDSDDDVWVQGKMEDLHHGQQQDRSRRKKKSEQASPRRYRSPVPAVRRHQSPPPPRARGRSPKPLFGRHSPKRMRSPIPKAINTPSQTPRQGLVQVQFHLAGRPGMTLTKSLPRPPAIFTAMKGNKAAKHHHDSDCHLRAAIDIVKGLERKRQRRKEKFFQNYCNRARRGQIPERKPLPGRGAERMKELGLLMAGKKDPGNYVLSI